MCGFQRPRDQHSIPDLAETAVSNLYMAGWDYVCSIWDTGKADGHKGRFFQAGTGTCHEETGPRHAGTGHRDAPIGGDATGARIAPPAQRDSCGSGDAWPLPVLRTIRPRLTPRFRGKSILFSAFGTSACSAMARPGFPGWARFQGPGWVRARPWKKPRCIRSALAQAPALGATRDLSTDCPNGPSGGQQFRAAYLGA